MRYSISSELLTQPIRQAWSVLASQKGSVLFYEFNSADVATARCGLHVELSASGQTAADGRNEIGKRLVILFNDNCQHTAPEKIILTTHDNLTAGTSAVATKTPR